MWADPELRAQHREQLAAILPRLAGPPDFVAQYLAAERDLGRLRADIDPVQVAVLILAMLFGLAMAPTQGASGFDRTVLDDAVRTLVTGIGP